MTHTRFTARNRGAALALLVTVAGGLAGCGSHAVATHAGSAAHASTTPSLDAAASSTAARSSTSSRPWSPPPGASTVAIPSAAGLHLGDLATFPGDRGVVLRIAAVTLDDPLDVQSAGRVDAGDRYVAVGLQVTNIGTAPYSGALMSHASLTDGRRGVAAPNPISAAPCPPFPDDLHLEPRGAATGCVAFAVPAASALGSFQLTLPTSFGGETAWWSLRSKRERAKPGTFAAARDVGDEQCSATVTAGTTTSCPFATTVSARYLQQWKATRERDQTIVAASAATGTTVTMRCHELAHGNVICQGGRGAYVEFETFDDPISGDATPPAGQTHCGTVDATVQVAAVHVDCTTALAVAKAANDGVDPPDGFTCARHAVNAGAGFFFTCANGDATVTVTPE